MLEAGLTERACGRIAAVVVQQVKRQVEWGAATGCRVAAPRSPDSRRRRRQRGRNTPDAKPKALVEGQAMVAFKTTATKAIEEGKIKSIIDPTSADHVRRDAVRFVDEKRA